MAYLCLHLVQKHIILPVEVYVNDLYGHVKRLASLYTSKVGGISTESTHPSAH